MVGVGSDHFYGPLTDLTSLARAFLFRETVTLCSSIKYIFIGGGPHRHGVIYFVHSSLLDIGGPLRAESSLCAASKWLVYSGKVNGYWNKGQAKDIRHQLSEQSSSKGSALLYLEGLLCPIELEQQQK